MPRDYDNGCDWVLQCKVTKGEAGKLQTRYTLLPAEVTPLTKEERERVEKFIQENPLSVLRQPKSPEEIAELYEAYLKDPESKIIPGSGDWYKARKASRVAAANGTSSSGASTSTTGGVKFDEETTDHATESEYGKALDDDEGDESGSAKTLF
jgi:hypothetical protein